MKTFWENDQKTNFDLFVGPKWPDNRVSDAHNLHNFKSRFNEHVKQFRCETNGNVLKKWPMTRTLTYLRVQNSPKIRPLKPICYIPPDVAPSIFKARSLWIWWIFFEKIIENLICFTYLGAQNDSEISGPGSYLLHASKSSCSELINQLSCESNGSVSRK